MRRCDHWTLENFAWNLLLSFFLKFNPFYLCLIFTHRDIERFGIKERNFFGRNFVAILDRCDRVGITDSRWTSAWMIASFVIRFFNLIIINFTRKGDDSAKGLSIKWRLVIIRLSFRNVLEHFFQIRVKKKLAFATFSQRVTCISLYNYLLYVK